MSLEPMMHIQNTLYHLKNTQSSTSNLYPSFMVLKGALDKSNHYDVMLRCDVLFCLAISWNVIKNGLVGVPQFLSNIHNNQNSQRQSKACHHHNGIYSECGTPTPTPTTITMPDLRTVLVLMEEHVLACNGIWRLMWLMGRRRTQTPWDGGWYWTQQQKALND